VNGAEGRDRLLLGGALALAVVVAAMVSATGLNTHDEAWFLQVVARASDGDVLYRDVFFGSTPLSVYLTLPLVALFGTQIVWVKALTVASFAAALVLVVWIARRLGAGTTASVLLGTGVLALARPWETALYQPLATVLVLACLAATVAWLEQRGDRLVVVAGAAAGLCFASKQNVGLYALAALLGAIVIGGAGRRIRAALLALGGFLACALLPLVPVTLTGGLDAFADYGLTNKGRYVELAHVSYLDGLRARLDVVRDPGGFPGPDALGAVLPAYDVLLYGIAPAVLLGLAAAWLRAEGAERRRVGVVGLFVLAASAAVHPRADAVHLRFVAPVMLLGGWYAIHVLSQGLSRRWRRLGAIAAAAVLAPAALVLAALPALRIAAGGARFSEVPHTRGVLIDPGRQERMLLTAQTIARESAGGTTFILAPDAGFYYLVSGVENPTPYDYPLATAFGRTGQADVAAMIENGELDVVCLGLRRRDDLAPRLVVRAVRRTMEPGARTAACRVYRMPAAQ
jgi:4-amino-4-deoxy-L-arabinose transferase-like glycosyltransferase